MTRGREGVGSTEMSVDQYKVLDSKVVFRGRVISLRTDELEMSDGSVARREVVEHPGAVAILALDEHDNVVMVRQYRHPVSQYVDELPAGLLDVDAESALQAAHRELFEEAALTARTWNVLVDIYPSPGMSDEAIRIFLARDLVDVAVAARFLPEHEEITMTVFRVPLSDAVERALRGELINAAAVAGVLAADRARSVGWRDIRAAGSPWPARPGR
jgi:8-oxo-dGTP pyrophosphatase MutT (NUDIX family)